MFLKNYNAVFAKELKNEKPHYECALCVFTYFMGCVKKASFLYLQLLQYESIIPIKASPDRRLPFPGFSEVWPSLCQPPFPRHFCFHAPQYNSTKQATKRGWECFWQRMALFCGIAQRCPRMRPQASWGCWPDPGNSGGWLRGRKPMSLGCLQCFIWPHPTGQLSASQRTFVLTRNCALLWEVRLVWKERFIKRSIGNLLEKLWTCWMCMLQVILPQIYFLIFL